MNFYEQNVNMLIVPINVYNLQTSKNITMQSCIKIFQTRFKGILHKNLKYHNYFKFTVENGFSAVMHSLHLSIRDFRRNEPNQRRITIS